MFKKLFKEKVVLKKYSSKFRKRGFTKMIMHWQPIETAPKDRAVLCYEYPVSCSGIYVAHYNKTYKYWEAEQLLIFDYRQMDRTIERDIIVHPTHWMPLPYSPDQYDAEKEGLETIKDVVNSQAQDFGLWILQPTISEAYLQQALRKLHGLLESYFKLIE